jgi:hypothetical protein
MWKKYDIKFLVLRKYLLILKILPKPLFNEACSGFQVADFDTKICSESSLACKNCPKAAYIACVNERIFPAFNETWALEEIEQ